MNLPDTASQFLSTAEAANMLGVSTTLIQTLVDKNELVGWKTRGGHRRISLQSLQDYQNNAQSARGLVGKSQRQPKVLVVAETPELLPNLQKQCDGWLAAFDLKLLDSISAALLELPLERPDMLIAELSAPRGYQEKTVTALQGFNTRARPISIVLLTEEVDLVSTAPENGNAIRVVRGPLTPEWLGAFFMGVRAVLG